MTCPTCLKPSATEEDDTIFQRREMSILDGEDDPPLPDGWSDDEGSHLCWSAVGYQDQGCVAPDWFAAIKPADVLALRARVAELEEAQRVGDLIEQVRRREIGYGKAAELAKLPIATFLRRMGERGVSPFQIEPEELAQEVAELACVPRRGIRHNLDNLEDGVERLERILMRGPR